MIKFFEFLKDLFRKRPNIEVSKKREGDGTTFTIKSDRELSEEQLKKLVVKSMVKDAIKSMSENGDEENA